MEKALLLPIYPETGQVLGIGRTKLYELITSGELRTVKIGRRRLVPASAIEEYVARLLTAAATGGRAERAAAS